MTSHAAHNDKLRRAHEALERFSLNACAGLTKDTARLEKEAHAAIDALEEPVKDGEVEAATKNAHEWLKESLSVLDEALTRNNPEFDDDRNPYEAQKRAHAAIDKLASLARRGGGHARNCHCGVTLHGPYTDPRCSPLSLKEARESALRVSLETDARLAQERQQEGCSPLSEGARAGWSKVREARFYLDTDTAKDDLDYVKKLLESALAEGEQR